MASEFQIILQLDALIQKTETLTRSLAEARQRVDHLESENKRLQTSIQEQERQLKDLPKKPAELQETFLNPKEIVKIVSDNPASKVSNAELKQKLDEYIQEIDRCIAHLSNLS